MSKGRRVLIVEDSSDVAALEADIVAACGAHAMVVSDGETALGTIRHERFVLILLDLTMPNVTGQAILTALAADADLCQIPVIVVSGSLAGFQPTGQVVAILPKPFSADKLTETIQRILTNNGKPAIPQLPNP